jgi:uncharacterized protein (TIGR02594 family)
MPKKIELTLYDYAKRKIGLKEIPGQKDHPLIVYWLSLCEIPEAHDEVPWCSASLVGMCDDLGLPCSYSAAARSWLLIGTPIELKDAEIGNDIVVLKRGDGEQPGPEVINAQGHVGIFAGLPGGRVQLLGGNQGNTYCHATFPVERVIGVRRLL